MKRTLTLITFISFFAISAIQAQAPAIPTVPSSVGFAGMNVKIDDDARAIIQSDVKALLGNRKYWESKLDRCVMYFPLIEGILIDENIPTDFKFLALQESGLQPDAVSASNAVGFWQFKKETAVDYGLRVDDMIDERKNITASTRAAARYLKKSNTQFNNWVASLYSYYLGAGGISKNIPSEWSYAKEVTLDGKSDRYILRFFAHKIAVESAIDRYQSPIQTVLLEYTQAKGRTLRDIASELSIDEATLRNENRWLNANEIPTDRDYSLIVPANSEQLSATRARLSAVQKPNQRDNFTQKDIGFPVLVRAEGYSNDLLLYEINGLPGIMAGGNDNVESLARKAKISFSSFLRYNEMSERDPIVPGDVYYLAKKGKRAVVPFHTVREGESLWKVSQVYGIRLKYIVKNNRIDNRNQRPQTGRVLWLTKKRPRNTPVEVVDMPQDEWVPGSGKAQPRPAVQENTRESTTPTASNKIPQNPSERKVYTPKMADTTPPAKSTTNESTLGGVEVTDAASLPKQGTSTAAQPAKTNKRAPSFNPNDDDRVVIINDDEPVRQTPANKPANKTTANQTAPQTTTKQQPVVKNTTPPSTPKETVKEEPIVTTKTETPKPKTTPPPSVTATSGKVIKHVVEPGQTFYSISKMYDVTVNDILYWNNLPQDAKLLRGQKLTIRPVGNTLAQQPKVEEFVNHTVAQGETMFSISQKYGVKVDQIKEWNGLPDTGVKLGQQLKIKKQ